LVVASKAAVTIAGVIGVAATLFTLKMID